MEPSLVLALAAAVFAEASGSVVRCILDYVARLHLFGCEFDYMARHNMLVGCHWSMPTFPRIAASCDRTIVLLLCITEARRVKVCLRDVTADIVLSNRRALEEHRLGRHVVDRDTAQEMLLANLQPFVGEYCGIKIPVDELVDQICAAFTSLPASDVMLHTAQACVFGFVKLNAHSSLVAALICEFYGMMEFICQHRTQYAHILLPRRAHKQQRPLGNIEIFTIWKGLYHSVRRGDDMCIAHRAAVLVVRMSDFLGTQQRLEAEAIFWDEFVRTRMHVHGSLAGFFIPATFFRACFVKDGGK